MEQDKTGIVYLIGAGPGDPGLITVKGHELLFTCDAIIYDHLVPDELIVRIPSGVDMYYVGKKAGDHPVPQEKINDLMFKLASQGKNVARLKGSDPLIFGRGGEEAKFLKEHGIKFEIVPGVTSGVAAPAYAGIPCTDREKASFVLFVTGHKSSEKLKSTVPWKWVAGARGGTLVIYMGVGEIEKITEKLISFGMPPDTPAAVIERGTYPSQRIARSVLGQLPQTVKAENIRPPALFVIGHVVDLQPWLEWFDRRPLSGLRIMITRPVDQALGLYRELRDLGAEPMPYPTIATEPADDPEGWKAFRGIGADNKWLIFTSENGIRYFFEKYYSIYQDVRKLAAWRIAVVGHGTANALRRYHFSADFVPGKSTVADLAAELKNSFDLRNSVIVRVRGNLADDTLENSLSKAGAEVIRLTTYNTVHPDWPVGLKDKLFEYPPHAILFTSGSSVKGLYHNLSEEEIARLAGSAKIFSLGPMVTRALKDRGLPVTAQAEEFTIDGLLETVKKHYSSLS